MRWTSVDVRDVTPSFCFVSHVDIDVGHHSFLPDRPTSHDGRTQRGAPHLPDRPHALRLDSTRLTLRRRGGRFFCQRAYVSSGANNFARESGRLRECVWCRVATQRNATPYGYAVPIHSAHAQMSLASETPIATAMGAELPKRKRKRTRTRKSGKTGGGDARENEDEEEEQRDAVQQATGAVVAATAATATATATATPTQTPTPTTTAGKSKEVTQEVTPAQDTNTAQPPATAVQPDATDADDADSDDDAGAASTGKKRKRNRKRSKKGADADAAAAAPPLADALSSVPDPHNDAALAADEAAATKRAALCYAHTHHASRSTWKFQKAKEAWLLRHLLTPPPPQQPAIQSEPTAATAARTDTVSGDDAGDAPASSSSPQVDNAIPDAYLALVANYLATMQGKSKERLVQELRGVVDAGNALPAEEAVEEEQAAAEAAATTTATTSDSAPPRTKSVSFADVADEQNARDDGGAPGEQQQRKERDQLRWKSARARVVLQWLS